MNIRILLVAAASMAALLLSGCTEEKARALKLTADTFKAEADLACSMGLESLTASIAMAPQTRDEIAADIDTSALTPELLQVFYTEPSAPKSMRPVAEALDRVCVAHQRLAAMYADLPRGYLLSAADVKQAHRHVVNVVVRFSRLAKTFAVNPTVGRDNIARTRIIEAQEKAMAIRDNQARSLLLKNVAAMIDDDRKAERDRRAQVMTQFAKAVASGENLIKASGQYDQLSAADVLDLLRDFASLYGSVTGRAAIAEGALARVDAAETRIRNDPLLSPLLDPDLK